MMTPRHLLDLPDDKLLAQCEVQLYRASGPGGQHRNKVTSGVRLRHSPTGVTVNATERRSQHENRRHALRRLRMQLALQLRTPRRPADLPPDALGDALVAHRGQPDTPGRRFQISPRNPRFWNVAAEVLDLLLACEGRIGDVAAHLDVTSGNLVTFLKSDRHLLHAAQEIRRQFDHKPLT